MKFFLIQDLSQIYKSKSNVSYPIEQGNMYVLKICLYILETLKKMNRKMKTFLRSYRRNWDFLAKFILVLYLLIGKKAYSGSTGENKL